MLRLTILSVLLLACSCKADHSKLIGKWAIDTKSSFPDTLRILRYKKELTTSINYDVQTLRHDSERDMMTIHSNYLVGCIMKSVDYHVKYMNSLDKLYIEQELATDSKKPLIQSALYSKVSD